MSVSAFAPIAARRDFYEHIVFADHSTRRRPSVSSTATATAAGSPPPASMRATPRPSPSCAAPTDATRSSNAVDPRFVMPVFEGAFDAGATYMDMAMSLSAAAPGATSRARRA